MIQERELFDPKWKIQASELWLYFYQRSYSSKRTGWYKFYPPSVGHNTHYLGMHRRPGKKIVLELEARFPAQAQPAELEYNNLVHAAKETRREAMLRFPHYGQEYSTLVEARSFLDKTKYDEFNASKKKEHKQAEISIDKKTLTELFSSINEYLATGAIGRIILRVAAKSDSPLLDLARENTFPFEALGYKAFLALIRLKEYGIKWSKELELFDLLKHADTKRLQNLDKWQNTVLQRTSLKRAAASSTLNVNAHNS